MRRIVLDGSGWQTPEDVYASLLPALQAPDWLGRNLDALWDTLTECAPPMPAGTPINGIQPPFEIVVRLHVPPAAPVRELLARLVDLFADANAEYGVAAQVMSLSVQDSGQPQL